MRVVPPGVDIAPKGLGNMYGCDVCVRTVSKPRLLNSGKETRVRHR
jgi:hypothetical protein